jgi:hypothetical protein
MRDSVVETTWITDPGCELDMGSGGAIDIDIEGQNKTLISLNHVVKSTQRLR